ncbi:expressed unknown protein [Seminavis robusta]|uniref:Uncharacterized protein n=1 Tax=Seminavis robusta TaxID=568900 RepID=A0A9N8EBH5_9STRA|nr:expressed unknown protein [Seminavis robusta]|eukprot:Sro880_g215120.1 n/a (87) ;mRNA; f:36836-37096
MKGLFPMLRLAELAYEPNTEELEQKLKEEGGYEFYRHKTDSNVGQLGYYVALNRSEKILLFGVRGAYTLSDAVTDTVSLTINSASV